MKFSEIPKFVVNLETRPDNLELIKKEMDYIGWEFEKFNAVNRNSYMGCTLSHLEVIKIAKERGMTVLWLLKMIVSLCHMRNHCWKILKNKLKGLNLVFLI